MKGLLALTLLGFVACGKEKPADPNAAASSSVDSTATTGATPDSPEATASSNTPCPNPPECGDDCSNQPFEKTTCWTTPYGPASADVVVGNPLESPNMLYCENATYGLCFFSGPPQPTGNNPENPPLPCLVQGGIARCACQTYTGSSFVDINAISNFGAYNQTVVACGADGSRCANIVSCGPDGQRAGCTSLPQAPVCQYIADQSRSNPEGSLVPGADLISTFSFAMSPNYPLGSTSCASGGLYAGCMTAPCFYEEGSRGEHEDGEAVVCECSIANGPFQVGQDNQSCSIPSDATGSYVWSASYSVSNP